MLAQIFIFAMVVRVRNIIYAGEKGMLDIILVD